MTRLILIYTSFFFFNASLFAQNYIPGTLYYRDGSTKELLIGKKIEGPSIKVKAVEGKSYKVKSEELASLELVSGSRDDMIRFVYGKYVNFKGELSSKSFWYNEIIAGEMSLYAISYVAIGNPAGSGTTYFLKRKKEEYVYKINAFRFVDTLSEYFEDRPEIVEMVQSKSFSVEELVFRYNELEASQ